MKLRVLTLISLIFVIGTLFLGGCVGFSDETVVEDGETAASPPTGHPTLIAHAGGAVYGYRYTNSLEALDSAYANGFRFIELDMSLSSDDGIVLVHDWEAMVTRMTYKEGQLTKEEFLSSEAFAGVTLMDIDRLADWLTDHRDVIIITDIKDEDNVYVLGRICADYPDLRGNFIPQIYQREQYDAVRALGFERIIFTLYRTAANAEGITSFAAEKDLWAVTIPQEILSEELINAVHYVSPTTAVYCNTINDLSFYEQWSVLGLSGIYTDYFIPDKWPYALTVEEAEAGISN